MAATHQDPPESGGGEKEDQESGVAVDEDEAQEPGKYAVLLHNDNYTTMEFVVEVLRRFFQKNNEQAVKIMLQIHNQGKGIAGIYSFEIAETKVSQVTDFARHEGHPLKCTVEEVR